MAVKVNELKQKHITAKAALNTLLEQISAARAVAMPILEKQMQGTALTADETKALTDANAKLAELSPREFAARRLEAMAEQEYQDEVERLASDDKTQERQRRANGGRSRRIETHDNAEDRPWAEGQRGLGEFCQAVHRAQTGQGIDPRLIQASATGMNEVMGPDGAFALPNEQASEMEEKLFESGQILSQVDARDIGGETMTYTVVGSETSRVDGSRQGAVLGYWVDEGDAPSASSVKTRRMEMKLRKVGALGYMTSELAQDAAALGGELEGAFVDELVFQVEDKIWEGAGAGSPLGITRAGCLLEVAIEAGQTNASGLNPKNLSNMWSRMAPRDRANAAWYIHMDVEPQLDNMYLAAGTAALEPRFITYGPDGTLRIKGRPVVAVEYASTVGTPGDIVLANFKKYRLIKKAGGPQTASSIHVRFANDEQTFRAFWRVDGQPVTRTARTPFKGTNTLSPFVSLAVRA